MDLETLDLKKLRAFYLVAKYGSLQRAASILGVTVSAVSFSIRRFEEQTGIQLFLRRPNKLNLTAAGEKMLRSAELIFAGIENALSAAPTAPSSKRRLAIAVNSDLAWRFIPKIIGFMRRHSDVELGVYIQSSTDSLRSVEKGELDMSIGRFIEAPKSVEKALIAESSISLVCPPGHPILRRKSPQLRDLAQYRLVTLPSQKSTKKLIVAAFLKSGIKPSGYIEAGSCQTISEFVKAEIGIGLMHSFCTASHVSSNLRSVDLSHCFGKVSFSAAYRKDAIKSADFQTLLEACLAAPEST